MEVVILAGGAIITYSMLSALTVPPQPKKAPSSTPWNPYVDQKGTYSSQPVVGHEYDVDPQHGIPIVWQILASGARRRVFLHRGEAVPQPPTID